MNVEGILILVLALFLYFLPTAIAQSRDHQSMFSIFALNLVLGWTVLGWFIALIWSFTAAGPPVVVVAPAAAPAGAIAEEPERIPCPHCAELIFPAAKVCKHCGRDVSPR